LNIIVWRTGELINGALKEGGRMKTVVSTRKWKVIFAVLLVAVPFGIVGTFTLMSAEPRTIMVEPVSWQMHRPKLDPRDTFNINETVVNGYSDNYTSIEISVYVMDYVEDWAWIPFGKDKDGIVFKVNITAAVAEGFESFFALRFRTVDAYSTVYIESQYGNVSGQYLATYNATIIELRTVSKEWINGNWHNTGEAYVKAECTDIQCSLSGQIYWVFNDQNNENHQLEIILEFTYFNQTTNQKIVMPIILNMPIST
jgi:hypothetical protein